eukprot:2234504-Prymnesium_polylepis.1
MPLIHERRGHPGTFLGAACSVGTTVLGEVKRPTVNEQDHERVLERLFANSGFRRHNPRTNTNTIVFANGS